MNEFFRRRLAPLRNQRLLGGHQVGSIREVETVAVGPVLVHAAPRVRPIVVDLAAEHMTADPPHVLIGAGLLQEIVAHADVVDVLHLERQMIEPGLLMIKAKEHVVIHVGVATVATIERADQVVLLARIDIVRADEAERLAEPSYGFVEARRHQHVKRIGHGVLMTSRFHETIRWFRETLGFICSDDVYAGEKDNLIGSFNRCDRGDAYVDHHVLFCLNHQKTGLNHLSFEVQDIDDVCMGHDFLKQTGAYEHMWGIGRHVLGSQVYDYWADPWGRVHEHWADSDRLNLANGSNLVPAEEALVSQWGEAPPEKFINHASP